MCIRDRLQIEQDGGEPRPERPGDFLPLAKRAGKLLSGELKPCGSPAHPHAEIAVVHPGKRVLGLLHMFQHVPGNGCPRGNARREAGIGGLVPREQPGLTGERCVSETD